MSAFGWCWRCAEQDQSRRGWDTGRYQGPLCPRCEVELDEYHATFTPPPVLPAEWYERPIKVGRARRWRRL